MFPLPYLLALKKEYPANLYMTANETKWCCFHLRSTSIVICMNAFGRNRREQFSPAAPASGSPNVEISERTVTRMTWQKFGIDLVQAIYIHIFIYFESIYIYEVILMLYSIHLH